MTKLAWLSALTTALAIRQLQLRLIAASIHERRKILVGLQRFTDAGGVRDVLWLAGLHRAAIVYPPSGCQSVITSSARARTGQNVRLDVWEETTQEETRVCVCEGEADIPSCWETVFWL